MKINPAIKQIYLAATMMWLFSITSVAATITVDQATIGGATGGCDLVEAIDAANSGGTVDTCIGSASADTIVFDLPAISLNTITLDTVNNNDFLTTGLPTVNSVITIDGGNDGVIITRAASAPVFRFFLIVNGGNLTLNKLTLSNGSSPAGGAIALQVGSTVEINDSTLKDNFAALLGGAISISGGTPEAILRINRSTFSSNTINATSSGLGGVIFGTLLGTITIYDSTFTDNSVTAPVVTQGGVIFMNNGPSLTIENSIFANNSVNGPGSNFGAFALIVAATANFKNNLFVDNSGAAYCFIVSSTITSLGNNRTDEKDGMDNPISTCGLSGASGDTLDVSLNANLAALADNGGPTATHALGAMSAALNVGLCTSGMDQRGAPRPGVGKAGLCDMGAYETGAPLIAVNPASLFFNPVEVGNFAEQMLLVTNNGNSDLSVTAFSTSLTDYTVPAPVPPVTLKVLEESTVTVRFSPTIEGVINDTLEITSNDLNSPTLVPLSGEGVPEFIPPDEQVANILAFYNDPTNDINGVGNGNSADNKFNALGNQILALSSLINNNMLAEACEQMNSILKKTDDQMPPKDFVEGADVAELNALVQDLADTINCP